MGKYEKRRKSRKSLRRIILLLGIVLLLALLPVILPFPDQPSQEAASGTETSGTEAEIFVPEASGGMELPTQPRETVQGLSSAETVSFPLPLEDGKLLLESLFPFEGLNPDCGNLEGSKTAAVLIRNVSGQYLKSATVRAVLGDGTLITFTIADLPADKEMLAFSVENAQLEDAYQCAAVEAETLFEDMEIPEGIGVCAEGLTVTVTNETQTEMNGIEVFCHGIFGAGYYGGITYVHTIEKLAPGERTSVTVSECLLGMVDVARILVNSQG